MHLQAAFLFTQEIGKFFALTALDLLKLNNSMMTQHKNFININDGYRNNVIPMYIH